MKKTTLLVSVLFLIAQVCIHAQTDVTDTYLTNPGFDIDCNFLATDSAKNLATINDGSAIHDVSGWTKPELSDWTAAATFEYGYAGSLNGQPIPSSAKDTSIYGAGHGTLGLTIGWGATIAYTQEVTLPAGIYTLKYNAYNSHPDVTLGKSATGWIPPVGDPTLSSVSSFPSTTWIEDEVLFMVKEETTGQIQVGYTSISGTSTVNGRVYYDDLQLTQMPLSDDATLDSLYIEDYALDSEFDPNNDSYEINVPYGTQDITLSTVPHSQFASVAYFYGISGEESTDGVIPFSNDGVDVEIIVTASTGTEITYYLGVYVEDGAKDASLKDITLSVSAIEPAFDKEIKEYTAIVPQGTTTVDVTGLAAFEGASVSGDGTLTLVDGTVSTTITVTSQNGNASEDYKLTINAADGTNYALHLAGGNGPESHVLLQGNNINAMPITLEMWIKPEGDQVNNSGLFQRTGSIGLQYASGWQGSNLLRFLSNDGEGGMYGGSAVSGTITPEVWHHVAVIMTDSTRTMYVDGIATTENAGAAAFSAMDFSADDIFLGWDGSNNERAFKGLMDEVRVWDAALTTETLDLNKYEVLHGDEDHLLAYYNFDVNSKTSAIDLSNTEAHGTIVGGTYETSFPRANLELKDLAIDGVTLYPAFSNGTTHYNVTLPAETSSITVSAEAVSSTTTVSGAGSVAVSGQDSIVITVASGEYAKDYIIHYTTAVELTLMHSYTFVDGTAKDVVGNADGTLYGEGYIEEGIYYADSLGSYISFPGDSIKINTYPAITMELFINDTEVINPNQNTMVSYIGGHSDWRGADGLFFSAKDASNGCKTSVFCNNYSDPWNSESSVLGPIIGEDGSTHHVVTVLNNDSISLYLDGTFISTTQLSADNKIFDMSNASAFLCKSGYSGDNTWLGAVLEFNLYKGEMDAASVALNYTTQMSGGGVLKDASTDATLSNILLGDSTIEGFNPTYMNYTLTLPYGTTEVPTINATAKVDGASATVTKAASLAETTTITVTSKDGKYSNTYTISFETAENPADASLNAILVNGTAIDNFNAATLAYTITVEAGASVPTIIATATNTKAWVSITEAATLADTTFIVVMPEDSSLAMTYTVNFEEAAALKQAQPSTISVFPSVSRGEFTVKTDGSLSTITVYSLSGAIVKQITSNTQETHFSVDKAQMYLLSVANEKERQVFRIIKK